MTTSQITEQQSLPPLLTERELADRWQVHPGSLANARSAGRAPIPFVKLLGRVRYRAADVLAYEARTAAA